jgi:hypothetical protein
MLITIEEKTMDRLKICFCVISLCVLAIPTVCFGQTQQLPIGDFFDAQASAIGWIDPATDRTLYFNAFGKRAKYYNLNVGSTFEGREMVRVLADGRAHVTVILHTRNAICWGFQGDGEGNYIPAFGYSPGLVAGGYVASLGDGMMNLEFTMPSPDSALQPVYQIPLESIVAVINCKGELRDGSGSPDGTPGLARTTQRVLYTTGVPSGCPAGDCAPTERVEFEPIGKKP